MPSRRTPLPAAAVELYRRVLVMTDLARDQPEERVLKITLRLRHNGAKEPPAVPREAAAHNLGYELAVGWDRAAATQGKHIAIRDPDTSRTRAAGERVHRRTPLRREIIVVNNRAAREKQLQREVHRRPTLDNRPNPGAAVVLLADDDLNSTEFQYV